jgi:hypothetical protein
MASNVQAPTVAVAAVESRMPAAPWRQVLLRMPWDTAFALLALVVLSLVAGMRMLGTDGDYLNYHDFYASLRPALRFSDFRYEPGFIVLSWLCKSILDLDFAQYLTFIAAISLSIKFYLLRDGWRFWPILLCYALSIYLTQEMTQIRAALGLSLGYLAGQIAMRGRHTRALVVLALGVSMHYSAIVCSLLLIIPAVWRLERRRPPVTLGLAIFLTGVLGSVTAQLFSFLNPLIQTYADEFEATVNPFSGRNLIVCAFVAVGLASYSRLPSESRAHLFFTIAGLVFFFATTSIPPVAHRLLELTMFSMFLVGTKARGKTGLTMLTLLIALSLFLYYRQQDYSLLRLL